MLRSRRTRRLGLIACALTLMTCLLAFLGALPHPWPTAGLTSAQSQGQIVEINAVKNDTSPRPVKEIPRVFSLGGGHTKKEVKLNPNRVVNLGPPETDPLLESSNPAAAAHVNAPKAKGGKAKKHAAKSVVSMIKVEGLGLNSNGFSVENAPPDTDGAVGDTQFVQWVNTSFAVFDKATGKLQTGPILGNKLWEGFGGNCENSNDGDPIVQYDKQAKRWVLAQFAVSGGFSQCVAVSTSADANGTYHRYEFKYESFDDYPKMGVWPDGYYTSFNMFNGNTSLGARVCVFNRAAMLNGQPATQQCVQLDSSVFGILPADLDGSTPPPASAPNYFVGLGNDSKSLNVWQFHVVWGHPQNSTFGVGPTHAPNQSIPVARFTFACNGTGAACVPQPGAGAPEKLDTLGERLMFRLAYRNFGDHESLVVNHSVDTGGPKARTAVRWYELRNPGNPILFQQGTFSPDNNSRWIASIAMDKTGNIALGYNVSSAAIHPSIRFATREKNDPVGILGNETTLKLGSGTQRCTLANGTCTPSCRLKDGSCDTLNRWGDYSSITIDPADDCTFWYTAEYLAAPDGAYNWHTRIGSFKFKSCSQ